MIRSIQSTAISWNAYVSLLLLSGICGCGNTDFFKSTPELVSFEIYNSVPGYMLNKPISVGVDSPYVFIADERDCNIAVLDWDLNWLYNIGRRGEGPGEFNRISDIDARNGMLAVVDRQHDRVTVLSYSGEYLGGFHAHSVIAPQVSLTDRNTVKLLSFEFTADNFIHEYSISGDLINSEVQRPDYVLSTREADAQMIIQGDQTYIVYVQSPWIVGFGHRTFEWSYDYVKCFPYIRRALESVEWQRNRGRFSLPYYHGGLALVGDKLIIAGIHYTLLVVDLISGEMFPISTGELGDKFIAEGRSTFEDVKIKGTDLILISKYNSCLLTIPLEDVMDTAEKGNPLLPLTDESILHH